MGSITLAIILLSAAWLVGYAVNFDAKRLCDILCQDKGFMWSDLE